MNGFTSTQMDPYQQITQQSIPHQPPIQQRMCKIISVFKDACNEIMQWICYYCNTVLYVDKNAYYIPQTTRNNTYFSSVRTTVPDKTTSINAKHTTSTIPNKKFFMNISQ